MPFGYYDRLSPEAKLVYDVSAIAPAFRLSHPSALWPDVEALKGALEAGRRPAVERAAQALCDGITSNLGAPQVKVRVFLVRPSWETAELHGLYKLRPRGAPVVHLWMRTAKLGRVVAFRTFLRTLLHEVCHHLDLELLRLPASFHTEGFYRRESALVHQLAPRPVEPIPEDPNPSRSP